MKQSGHRIARLAAPLVAGAVMLAPAGGAFAQKLYDEATYKPLAADHKAFRIGDIITIQVYEQSSASTSTDTSTQRTNGVNVGLASSISGVQRGGSISQGGNFDGGGTTQRSNQLLATLSVTVTGVMRNGDLKVAGEQILTVNDEHHRVSVDGVIRPQDISSDNIVQSTRLADAHINYVGDGELSKRQKPAWWRSLLDAFGL